MVNSGLEFQEWKALAYPYLWTVEHKIPNSLADLLLRYPDTLQAIFCPTKQAVELAG